MRRWGVKTDIYWCPHENAPSRDPECGGYDNGFKLRVAEPADIRPAFQGDLEIIREAITGEFGEPSLMERLNIREWSTYLNKAPHFDDMKEVLVGGSIVGRLYFDPRYMTWRWRLSQAGIEEALELGLIRSFTVNGSPRPLQVLGDATGLREGTQAAVTDREGRITGLAVVKKGKFRIQSIFRGDVSQPIRRVSSFSNLLKVNSFRLRTMESKAVKHVAIMAEKTGLKPVVSYSGGKDSLVALDITLKAGLEPELLFNDTGLELPPTLDNVGRVANLYGLKVVEASAGDLFWKGLDVFGPPAKDYRWCCKVVKMAPIGRVYRARYPDGSLVIIGQRGYESVARSRSGKVWRNRWLPSALNIAPIQEWDQLSVWIYLLTRRLPVNELYFRGFDRLGCYLCPAGNVAEYFMVNKFFPELWRKWLEKLERWRRKAGFDRVWAENHLWRWVNPRAQGRRRVERWLGIKKPRDWLTEYRIRSGYSVKIMEKRKDEVHVLVEPGISLDSLINQWRVLGTSIEVREDTVNIRKGSSDLHVKGNTLRGVGPNSLELVIDAIKVAVRWEKCVGCQNCVNWCPNQAINVLKGKPYVMAERCDGCGICLEVCPVSEVFVERLIVSQLIGDPKGRPRKKIAVSVAREKVRRARKNVREVKPAYSGIATFLSEEHCN